MRAISPICFIAMYMTITGEPLAIDGQSIRSGIVRVSPMECPLEGFVGFGSSEARVLDATYCGWAPGFVVG